MKLLCLLWLIKFKHLNTYFIYLFTADFSLLILLFFILGFIDSEKIHIYKSSGIFSGIIKNCEF